MCLAVVAVVIGLVAVASWIRRRDAAAEQAAVGPRPSVLANLRTAGEAARARFEAEMRAIQARIGASQAADSDDPLATLVALHQKARADLTNLVANAKDNPDVQAALKMSEDAVVAVTTLIIRNLPPPPLV